MTDLPEITDSARGMYDRIVSRDPHLFSVAVAKGFEPTLEDIDELHERQNQQGKTSE